MLATRVMCVMAAVLPALARAQDQSQRAALFEAFWFFGVMIVAMIVLVVLRVRDASLPKEERVRRAQKRLPFAIGAIAMACAPLLFP
jgi:hypothetical protein